SHRAGVRTRIRRDAVESAIRDAASGRITAAARLPARRDRRAAHPVPYPAWHPAWRARTVAPVLDGRQSRMGSGWRLGTWGIRRRWFWRWRRFWRVRWWRRFLRRRRRREILNMEIGRASCRERGESVGGGWVVG